MAGLAPASFTIRPQAGGGQENATQAVQINTGITGGPSRGPEYVDPVVQENKTAGLNDKTVDALLQVAGTAAKAQWDKKVSAQVLDSTMRAMQGESAASIAKENLFGDIFGDSAAVQAARVVEVQRSATDMTAAAMASMDELRTKSPTQLREWYASKTNELFTGDQASDTLIAQQLLKQMPAIVDLHARENYQYTQDEAGKAWRNGVLSKAATLEKYKAEVAKLSTSGTYAPDSTAAANIENLKSQVAEVLVGPTGMSTDTFKKHLRSTFVALSADRSWATLDMLRDSGVLDEALDPEAVGQLETVRSGDEAKALLDTPVSALRNAEQIEAHLGLGAYMPDADLLGMLYSVNTSVKGQTGNNTPRYNEQQISELLARNWANKQRAAMQAEKAVKEDDTQAQVNAIILADAVGNQEGLAGLTITPTARAIAYKAMWDTALQSDAQMQSFLERQGISAMQGAGNPHFKQAIQGGLMSLLTVGKPNMQSPEALGIVRKLVATPNGMSALNFAMGSDKAVETLALLQLVGPSNDPKEWENAAMSVRAGTNKALTKQESADLTAYFKDAQGGWFSTGPLAPYKDDITPGAMRQLQDGVTPEVLRLARLRPGLVGTDTLYQLATDTYLKKHEFVKGVFTEPSPYVKGTDSTVRSVVQGLLKAPIVDSKKYQSTVNTVLDNTVKSLDKHGEFTGGYNVISVVDNGGEGAERSLMVAVMPSNPKSFNAPLTFRIKAGHIANAYKDDRYNPSAPQTVPNKKTTGLIPMYVQE